MGTSIVEGKMMKYEPLSSKKQKMKENFLKLAKKDNHTKDKLYLGFEKGVDDSFDLFASIINLYRRYKNNVKLLMNEQHKIWSKWVDYYNSQSDINASNYLDKYNNWLFNYTFSNIDGENSDDLFML